MKYLEDGARPNDFVEENDVVLWSMLTGRLNTYDRSYHHLKTFWRMILDKTNAIMYALPEFPKVTVEIIMSFTASIMNGDSSSCHLRHATHIFLWENFDGGWRNIVWKNFDHIEALSCSGSMMGSGLITASRCGRMKIVKALITMGADMDYQSHNCDTALIQAARHGSTKTVKYLIDVGANLNKRNKQGDTALLMAVKEQHSKIVDSLATAGANVNLSDHLGETPLLIAAGSDNSQIVKCLITAEAHVNSVNQDVAGYSALMLAASLGHVDNVRLLIEAKAYLNFVNGWGDSALFLAKRLGHDDIVDSLRRAGASGSRTTKSKKFTVSLNLFKYRSETTVTKSRKRKSRTRIGRKKDRKADAQDMLDEETPRCNSKKQRSKVNIFGW